MSFVLLEYLCFSCETRHESLEVRGRVAEWFACPCGSRAELTISAVRGRTPISTVVRGSSPEPPPFAIDTRPLAEGMPYRKWRADSDAKLRRQGSR